MSKNITYELVLPVVREAVERMAQRISDETKYENATESNFQAEEVEHKAMSGFMPFTNGGYSIKWFDNMDWFISTGYKLPTNTLQKKIEEFQENGYNQAKDDFIREYPEIVEEIGEENINYNDLYEAGYGSEAEELSEKEMSYMQDETVMFEIGAYYYNPENSRSEDGKHTINLFGSVNLEAPYHRQGNLEDYIETKFTFDSIEELEELLLEHEDNIIGWMKGDNFSEGRELKIVRMKKGGSMKKNWIAGALSGGKNKGALRRTAMRKGLLRNDDENLSKTDLHKLEKMGGKTAKRAHLAETLMKFDEGGNIPNSEIKGKIEAILNKVVPKFFHSVSEYKSYFGDGKNLAIKIAASSDEINKVRGQYPQVVSLSLDLKTLELHPQVFGGNGGQVIYRKPNMSDPSEKYLAMKSVKIPFRTPKKEEELVLKAIEKFAENYKLALKENVDTLMYQDMVDYKDLLVDVKREGGSVIQSKHLISGRYLDINLSENGNLIITINDEAREKINEMREESHCDDCIMHDLFDDIRGNSELIYFGDAGEVGLGMTSAPAITDGFYYNDEGDLTNEGHNDYEVYWFPNYAITSFIDKMIEDGNVMFNKAEQFKKGGNIKTSNQNSSGLVKDRTEFKASNLSGENIGDSYVVKSYSHYPIFVYKDGKWYENKDKYSVSTSKQTTQSRPTSDTIKLSTVEMKELYGYETGGTVTTLSFDNMMEHHLASDEKISITDVENFLGRKPNFEEHILGYKIRKCYLQPFFKTIK